MNTTSHKGFSSHKATVISTIMCVLAMMVLVVSCPLKRMLQNKVVSNTSPVAKTNHAGKYISNSPGCSFVTDKIFSVKPELSRNNSLRSPLYLPVINKQPGADIHYSLSSLHLTHFNAASHHYAELSLFLQHMRLLI